MMTTVAPSSFEETSPAPRLSSWLRASRSARRASNFFLFASVARRALPRGNRKLRAYPSFTRTVSPMCPSLPTRSSKITSMSCLLFMSCRSGGGNEGGARAQPQEAVEKAKRRDNGKRVFGSQNAAGVERDKHQPPHLETTRQRMRDRQPLQRQSAAEPPGADREILGGRTGQRIEGRETGEECDAQRPGQGKRCRQIRPGPGKIARQLGRTSGGVEIDAQHHERRGGDRRRAKSHQRVSKFARRKLVRRAIESVGGEGGDG